MADPVKFSGFVSGTTPADGDNVVGLQGGVNAIWTWSQVWTYISGKLASTLALLAPLASPAFTGSPTAPTPTAGDNDTSVATTAFVQGELASKAPLASPALTGTPTAPTPSAADRSTKLVTTEFVKSGALMVLSKGAVAVPVTGVTVETTCLDLLIPGGTLGPNGQLRIGALFSCTNNANTKSVRFRVGGQPMLAAGITSTAGIEIERRIANRNSQSSQVVFPSTQTTFGTTTLAMATFTVDTSVDQHVLITATPTNTGDTITLESWLIEAVYGA